MPKANTPASGNVNKKMNKWAAINNDAVNGIQGVAYFFKSEESAKRFSRTGTVSYQIAK
jgi:hypothetical protein